MAAPEPPAFASPKAIAAAAARAVAERQQRAAAVAAVAQSPARAAVAQGRGVAHTPGKQRQQDDMGGCWAGLNCGGGGRVLGFRILSGEGGGPKWPGLDPV